MRSPFALHLDFRSGGSAEWIGGAFQFAAAQMAAGHQGSEAIDGLSELLFVEAIQLYVQTIDELGTCWLAGLKDPFVSRALGIMHARIEEAWTVDKLGREMGLSRSALAARFNEVIGLPAMRCLTNWRLHVAARKLIDSNRSVVPVAPEVGYDLEASLTRAFKRVMSVPPGAWRRMRGSYGRTGLDLDLVWSEFGAMRASAAMTVNNIVRLDQLPARSRLCRGERHGPRQGAERPRHPDHRHRRADPVERLAGGDRGGRGGVGSSPLPHGTRLRRMAGRIRISRFESDADMGDGHGGRRDAATPARVVGLSVFDGCSGADAGCRHRRRLRLYGLDVSAVRRAARQLRGGGHARRSKPARVPAFGGAGASG